MPKSVTSIGVGAFFGCSSLKKVVLTENISVIEDSTFDDCSALTDITIPEGVTCIESSAFAKCSNLTEITLPKSLTKIDNWAFDNWAFDNCSSLRSVTILAENPPSIPSTYGFRPFKGNDDNIKFYVPEDSVEMYETQWGKYDYSIKAIQ